MSIRLTLRATLFPLFSLFSLLGLLSLQQARADAPRMPPPPQVYLSECASCHVPYPPGLMAAADWRTTLSGLGRHFGTDASLSAAELQAVSAYLLDNAGDAGRYGSTSKPPRLSTTPWFERKHVRKLPADVWRNPQVKSAGQCAACHTLADKGSYAERDIAVPGYPGRHW